MARTGKIARLPKETRDKVNEWLDDGKTAEHIGALLEAEGFHYISAQNITNWRQGGYQDWKENQERMEAIRLRADASVEYVKMLQSTGSSLEEANALMLASQINELLQSIELDTIKGLLAEDPKKFFDLVTAVTSQSSERTKREKLELEFKKFREAVEEKKNAALAAVAKGKAAGGLTTDTLAEIEQTLKLL